MPDTVLVRKRVFPRHGQRRNTHGPYVNEWRVLFE